MMVLTSGDSQMYYFFMEDVVFWVLKKKGLISK